VTYNMTSLDIGCGNLTSHTARGDVNLDLDPNPAIRPPNFVPGDAHNLPFENEHFTHISFLEVIEHVENPSRCLREIWRVLKPDGTLEVSTPNPTHWRRLLRHLLHMRLAVWKDHISLWGREELENLLESCGFKIEETDFVVVPERQKYEKLSHRHIDTWVHRLSLCHALTGRSVRIIARKI